MVIEILRKKYHKNIFEQLLSVDEFGTPSNADKSSKISIALARGIVEQISLNTNDIKRSGQTSGKSFENLTTLFLEKAFKELRHLHGGDFDFFIGRSIDSFEQYEHLALLEKTLQTNRELRATLGDYIIKPDIVVGRKPVSDSEINKNKTIISGNQNTTLTPLRKANTEKLTLHASISYKWTIRSDRSQNARTEGLNLIRNRKGQTPHIVIVTAEPYPQRIASIALGTGDIDRVYHFALRELIKASEKLNNEAITDIIGTLVSGKRLRDISDLPFDLAI